jgi:hypothetical protein
VLDAVIIELVIATTTMARMATLMQTSTRPSPDSDARDRLAARERRSTGPVPAAGPNALLTTHKRRPRFGPD